MSSSELPWSLWGRLSQPSHRVDSNSRAAVSKMPMNRHTGVQQTCGQSLCSSLPILLRSCASIRRVCQTAERNSEHLNSARGGRGEESREIGWHKDNPVKEQGGSRQGKAHCKNLYQTMMQLSLTLQRDPVSLFWDKTLVTLTGS